MSGIRQHTIPRFLLRGFSFGKRRDGQVWYYRKDQSAVVAGITSIGVENRFYDTDTGTIDPAITAQEPDYATLVQRLRAFPSTVAVTDPRIPSLVQHLSLRTQALRAWTTKTMENLFTEASGWLLDPAVLKRILSDRNLVTRTVGDTLKNMGLDPDQISALLPLLAPDAPRLSGEWLGDVRHVIAGLVGRAAGEIPGQLRNGHNNALGALRDGPRIAAYRALYWHVVVTEEPLLLGDSAVVVAITGPQPFKALNDETDTLCAVHLPLWGFR